MAQINVTQFAKELGLPIELLIEQLQTAGHNEQQREQNPPDRDKQRHSPQLPK